MWYNRLILFLLCSYYKCLHKELIEEYYYSDYKENDDLSFFDPLEDDQDQVALIGKIHYLSQVFRLLTYWAELVAPS